MTTGQIKRVGLLTPDIKVIGDAHLGRRFVTGVPLHRRGDRELMVSDQFAYELLYVQGAKTVVQVGDIFDKFVVSHEVLMATYVAIEGAAGTNPDVSYWYLRGNHDAARDLEKVSSFDVLRQMCDGLYNVEFVAERASHIGDIAFCPWHPVTTAAEMVAQLPVQQYQAVFAHHDLHTFGGDDHNLIPLDALSKITKLVVTGHDHLPREIEANGMRVIVVGSMAPYAHCECAEDDRDPMYFTTTLNDLEQFGPLSGWDDLKNKCIRVLLAPGETLPTDIDCLQLTAKKLGADGEEESLDVDLGSFDMDALFKDAFADVDPDITAEMTAKFKELRTG